MRKKIVFMFSGQGSQYYHMGKELYDKHPRFKLWMDHCDKIVTPLIGQSLIDILYKQNKKDDVFDRILHTNPALLCIEYCLAKILIETGIKPDILVGYSLGEIAASVVSGAVSLEDGIKLTVGFAELIEKEGAHAGMLAVVAPKDILKSRSELFKNCWLTGSNFKNHFVMGGTGKDIGQLERDLKANDILVQRLAVNFAFHTEMINPLEEKFKQLAQTIFFADIKIPTISSFSCEKIDYVDEDYFWNVVRYPVDFEETITKLITNNDYIFIDVGPSGTLSTFIKHLAPPNCKSTYFEVMNQFGRDLISFEKVRNSLLVVENSHA